MCFELLSLSTPNPIFEIISLAYFTEKKSQVIKYPTTLSLRRDITLGKNVDKSNWRLTFRLTLYMLAVRL